MNKTFLDSNICIYAFDKSDTLKSQIAFNLLSNRPYISSQVIIEIYNACYRKLKLTSDICDENTLFLCDITEIISINNEIIKSAVMLRGKYQFSFLDSCIIATALFSGCSILYTEDMHHNLFVENSLMIINPFIAI